MTVADRSAAYPGLEGRSYSNPLVITYPLQAGTERNIDFGDGSAPTATAIKVPAGAKYFKILDVNVQVVEVFATDTTLGRIRIGTAADADAFMEFGIPDASAATDAVGLRDDTDAILYSNGLGEVDALTQLEVTFVNGTDSGTVTGQAAVDVTIGWW